MLSILQQLKQDIHNIETLSQRSLLAQEQIGRLQSRQNLNGSLNDKDRNESEDNNESTKPTVEDDSTLSSNKREMYRNRLATIVKTQEKMNVQTETFTKEIQHLQQVLRQKEAEVVEKKNAFVKLLRQTLTSPEETNVIINNKQVDSTQIEKSNGTKESNISNINELLTEDDEQTKEIFRLRLKEINLKRSVKKMYACIKQTEKLAEGLNLTDLEHIQTQDDLVTKKMSLRQIEVEKLTDRCQNLSTAKELDEQKIEGRREKIKSIRNEITQLDSDICNERDKVALKKKKYEEACSQNAKIKKQHALQKGALLDDYNNVLLKIKTMTEQLHDLKKRYRSTKLT